MKKHGMYGTPEYQAFRSILRRCNDINYIRYPEWGGRGIKCLFDSFEEFYAEAGNKPEPKSKYSLDRIDNNGNYEKGNIRWTSYVKQSRNTRRNRLITFSGETKCSIEWAQLYNINRATIENRIDILGWCNMCSVTIPVRGGTCEHR